MPRLQAHVHDELCRHARETFPRECCGVVLSKKGRDEVRRITNIQDAMHEQDPRASPRDATTAYVMAPKELLAVMREIDDGQAVLRVLYHSHPNHDAYFSNEDKTRAMFGDEPAYPAAAYVVISIYHAEVRSLRAYEWNDHRRDFVEVALEAGV